MRCGSDSILYIRFQLHVDRSCHLESKNPAAKVDLLNPKNHKDEDTVNKHIQSWKIHQCPLPRSSSISVLSCRLTPFYWNDLRYARTSRASKPKSVNIAVVQVVIIIWYPFLDTSNQQSDWSFCSYHQPRRDTVGGPAVGTWRRRAILPLLPANLTSSSTISVRRSCMLLRERAFRRTELDNLKQEVETQPYCYLRTGISSAPGILRRIPQARVNVTGLTLCHRESGNPAFSPSIGSRRPRRW